ncbi:MAG TPA: T9SS type A sorting domain-containing protein [Ignavibacteria bacterium]|mgnify:CR=1 FL=1|nr:T9SS type A sorting domain-containing protein [Ignavibacteria bacterium]
MSTSLKIFFLFLILYEGVFAQPVYWQRIYDLNLQKEGSCGIEAINGGYIIVSKWLGGSGFNGINIMKIDDFGIKQWEKNYNLGASNDIIETTDSGYLLVGGGLRASVFKINQYGDSIWHKQYGSSFNDTFTRIKKNNVNDYILCGVKSLGSSRTGAFVVYLNNLGNLIWQNIISDSLYNNIYGLDLLIDKNTNLAVTGWAVKDFFYDNNIFLFKLNQNGNLYRKKFILTDSLGDIGNRILKSTDNSYMISGQIYQSTIPFQCSHFTKIDTSGNIIFQKKYNTCTYYVTQLSNNYYTLAGEIMGKFGIIKVNEKGDSIYSKILNGSPYYSNINYPISTEKNNYLFTGYYHDTSFAFGSNSTYVALTDSSGNTNYPANIVQSNINIIKGFTLFPPFPNPFNSAVTIKFDIYEDGKYILDLFNVSGKKIDVLSNNNFEKGSYSLSFFSEFNNHSTGIYFIRLYNFNNSFSKTQKIIYLK